MAAKTWKLLREVALVLALFAAAPASAQTPSAEPDSAVVDLGKDKSERATVAVMIGEAGPFDFVVDTGADRTVVSRELATKLKMPVGESATMHTMTGVGPVDTVILSGLNVGGKRQKDINAPALSAMNLGASGLLGIDSLSGRRVVMDFRRNLFAIQNGSVREPFDPDTIVVTARARLGQLILVDADSDGVPVTVVVDSGASNSVGNLALKAMLAKKQRHLRLYPTQLTSVTGDSVSADFAIMDSIRLGGFLMKNVPITFADAHPFRRFQLLKKPAILLGMDTLRMFDRVSVDFAQRKVRFLLPDEASALSARAWFPFRSPVMLSSR